jgi:hypothetical protein
MISYQAKRPCDKFAAVQSHMLSHSLLLHAAYIQQLGHTSILKPNIVLLVVVLLYLRCGSTKADAVGHPRTK